MRIIVNKKNKVEQLKYIFKEKILILFFKNHLLMKMILHQNQLINLTLAFFNKKNYVKIKINLKKANSNDIISFLEKKNILSSQQY